MWNYFAPLFSPSFWFNLTPAPLLPWTSAMMVVVMVLLLVVGVIASFLAPRGRDKDERKIIHYGSGLAVGASVTGFLFYLFTLERVPVLSMRFFFLAWFVLFGIWTWKRIVKPAKLLPSLRKERVERENYEKWLPKPGKNK